MTSPKSFFQKKKALTKVTITIITKINSITAFNDYLILFSKNKLTSFTIKNLCKNVCVYFFSEKKFSNKKKFILFLYKNYFSLKVITSKITKNLLLLNSFFLQKWFECGTSVAQVWHIYVKMYKFRRIIE